MAEYDNTNSGALFENQRREKPSHPHLRGSATIKMPNGELVEYWVSAWQKTSKNGADFFSLSFQPKDEKGTVDQKPKSSSGGLFKKRDEAPASAKKSIDEDLDDSVPF